MLKRHCWKNRKWWNLTLLFKHASTSHLFMVVNVFVEAGTPNMSKQPIISFHNRLETSYQYTNQFITLQRVFLQCFFIIKPAFPNPTMGPLMQVTNVHMGGICPSISWFQMMHQHPRTRSLTLSRYWALLGPWGIKPDSKLWEITVRWRVCTACLFRWKNKLTVTEQSIKTRALADGAFRSSVVLLSMFHNVLSQYGKLHIA